MKDMFLVETGKGNAGKARPTKRLSVLVVVATGCVILAALQLPRWLDHCWREAGKPAVRERKANPVRRKTAGSKPAATTPAVSAGASSVVARAVETASNSVKAAVPAQKATNATPAQTGASNAVNRINTSPAAPKVVARPPPGPKPKPKLPPAPVLKKKPAAAVPKPVAPARTHSLPPDIAERLDEIDKMPWSRETEDLLLGVIYRWGEMDPQSALDYAIGLNHRVTRNTAVNRILNDWSSKFPQSAFDWFEAVAQFNPDLVAAYTAPMFKQLVASNPDKALASIWAMPTDGMKQVALATIATFMVSRNRMEEMFALHTSVSSETDRKMVADAIIQQLGRHCPIEVGDWISGMTDAQSRSRALDTFMSVWAFDDPAAAANWVASMPRGSDRTRQITRVTDNWVRDDPVGAADWLLSLAPPAVETDGAVTTFVRAVMRDNPEDAMSWTAAVADSGQRWKLAEEVAVRWAAKDNAGLRDYVLHADLPRDVRIRLKNIANTR